MTAGGPDNPYEPGTSDVPDSPAVREYHPLRFFYMAAVGVSLLTAGYLYLWNFDSRSEGQLILLSFSWLSILAGGGVGWVTLSHGVRPGKSLRYALKAAVSTPIALGLFFLTIWPSL